MTQKTKPRFNVIDAVVLVFLIGAAAFIGYKALSAAPPLNTDEAVVSFTVRIRNVYTDIAESFIKELPAGCVSGEAVVPGSFVKSAVTEPATMVTTTAEGVLIEGIDPTRSDLVVTVEGVCPFDEAIYKVGNQEVRIGRAFIVKTLSVEMTGTVTDMTVTKK